MIVVLDANVVASALWTSNGKAAHIVNQVIAGNLKLCYDYRILAEYRDILARPNFKFSPWQISFLLETFEKDGISVIPTPLPQVPFSNESDRVFFEVAKFYNVPLITGNVKHFPQDYCVINVADYYDLMINCG